jgi:hypothetical protein
MPRGALKSSLLLVGTLGISDTPEKTTPVPVAMSVHPIPPAEGIASVVTFWAAAWIEGNVEAMFAYLHPDLTKHILSIDTPDSRPEAMQRLLGVQSLLGRATREHIPETVVRVLDVQGHSGSARVDLGPWTAFIHLAAHRGNWAIANVLWEWRS